MVKSDEQKLSMQDWDVGINFPYDYDERGFPIYEDIVTNRAARWALQYPSTRGRPRRTT